MKNSDGPDDVILDLRAVATAPPWGVVAPAYAEVIGEALGHYAEDALRLAQLSAEDRVLDVATGPGTLARPAARVASHVDALDFSPTMLDELRRRATPFELARLGLHCGDGQALPFPDDHFDAAFSMFGLFMFPDRARALSELARVLRPGGRVVIGSWQPQTEVQALSAITDELRQLMPPDVVAPPLPLSDRASVDAEMSAAGFKVEVHSVTHRIEAPSLDALWHDLRRSHVALAIAEAQLPAPRFQELLGTIHARLERELGPGSQQMTMPAWLGLGRL